MTLNQRKAGVILSYASELAKILVNLFYTPVMLRLLGQSEYGLYQLVYSVVSYLSLLSLGFSASYMRFYSRYKAKDQKDEICRLNGMFMVIFCTISAVCILCGCVMITNIRLIFGTGLTEPEYHTARILMCLLVFNLALTFPSSVFNCIITAHEKFFFQKILMFLQNILSPFLALPLLLMGYGSVAIVSVTTFLTLAVLVSNAFFCFRKLHIHFCFRNFRMSLLREMWIFTFFIFLNQIIDQINWSVDKFLLGRLVGTAAVAVYGVGAQINAFYLQFSTSISNVFVPRVNRIVSESNDNNLLTKLFTKVGRIQFLVLLLVLSGFCFLGVPFIRIWAGEEYHEAYYVALALITPVTVPLIQNLGIEIQRAKNMHQARSIVYFFIALTNIFLSIPLIKRWNVIGATIGTAVSLIAGNLIFMNWYYYRKIGLDIPYFWKEILKMMRGFILPCVIGILIMKFAEVPNLIVLVLYIAGYTAVYGLSMYRWGLNEYEKNLVLGPLKSMTRRK